MKTIIGGVELRYGRGFSMGAMASMRIALVLGAMSCTPFSGMHEKAAMKPRTAPPELAFYNPAVSLTAGRHGDVI